MKKIEWFWNMLYYNVFRFDSRCRSLFNYFNPFNLINKLQAVKRHRTRYGVDDMNKFANRILNNPRSGISSIWSGSFMGGLIVLIEYSLFNIIQGITKKPLIINVLKDDSHFILFLLILISPTILINNYLLFKKDKFLIYFTEFESMSKEKKSMHSWLSFFVIILIFLFFIGSFLVL